VQLQTRQECKNVALTSSNRVQKNSPREPEVEGGHVPASPTLYLLFLEGKDLVALASTSFACTKIVAANQIAGLPINKRKVLRVLKLSQSVQWKY
jgi:hypothetical protein